MISLIASLVGIVSSLSPYATCGQPTGASATILVGSGVQMSHPDGEVETGDQIAALAPDGSCAGVVTWDGDGAALTVWVDDPFTEAREGLIPGEPVALAIWDASSGKAYESLGAKVKAPYGDPGVFMPDELYILEGIASTSQHLEAPYEFALAQTYPNPAQYQATLAFSLDIDERVTIDVFDTLGRHVARPVDREMKAGDHSVPVDVSALASGVYIYRLQAGQRALQQRMTVTR